MDTEILSIILAAVAALSTVGVWYLYCRCIFNCCTDKEEEITL